jgi:hypothetical protein
VIKNKKAALRIIPIILLCLAISGCADYQDTTSSPAISPSIIVTSPVAKPPPSSNPELTPKDPLEDDVIKADCIVSGKIVDKSYEGINAPTIFTLSVEKMIKGDPSIKEIKIEADAGHVGSPYFQISELVLVCLKKGNEEIYTVLESSPFLPDGRVSIEGSYAVLWSFPYENPLAFEKRDQMIGRILRIMRLNNIPIALPEKGRPPEPADPETPPIPLRTKETPPVSSPVVFQEGHFKEAVIESEYIVTGTISDKKYETITYDNQVKFVYTIYTLKVDKIIKGDPNNSELYVKTLGGKIDENRESILAGEIIFDIPSDVLGLTRKDEFNTYHIEEDDENTYFIGHGPLWVDSATRSTSPDLETTIGWLINDLRANNIPITLPDKDWPPLPVHFDQPK